MAITTIPSSGTTDGTNLVALGTTTVSSSVSQIDIDFDSSYKRILIAFEGMEFTNDCNLYARAKISGSINTGTNYTSGHVKKYYNGFDTNTYGGPNQSYWYVTNNIGGVSGEAWNGQFTIDVGTTEGNPLIHIANYYNSNAGNFDANFGCLAYEEDNIVEGIRVYPSTGSIESVKYTQWGIK